MISAHNFAPVTAGLMFWSDIFRPLFGFALLWLQKRETASDVIALSPAAGAASVR